MMYIDEFNEMAGTKYTKESFIKLFNQYFPEGEKTKSYNNQYKTMYEHALRFSIRTYVFNKDKENTDVTKVSEGLNTLFDEEISDYNKLMLAKGNKNKTIAFVKDAGLNKSQIKEDLFKCIDDIPKTRQQEELEMVKRASKIGQNLTEDEKFKTCSINRLIAINDADSEYSKEEKYERSLDVIRNMQERLDNREKNFRLTHPIKYSEYKKDIEDVKEIIVNSGYSKEDIDKDLLKPSSKNPLYEKLEDNIINGSKKELDMDDFKKQLGFNTSFEPVNNRTKVANKEPVKLEKNDLSK